MKINLTRTFSWLLAFGIAFLMTHSSNAQDNVGIGIANPHPSAKLHLADTLGKGFLIPRTDTNAVLAFVNSLTPNPGIANGLLIFQKSDQVFYYYDGSQSKWVPLSGIVGGTGPKGATGFTGPRGPQGRRGFVRDTNFSVLPDDRFGNYFINMYSGYMFEVDKLPTAWRPVSTPNVSWRGKMQGSYVAQASSTGPLIHPVPPGTTTFDYDPLPGLSVTVPVGFDSTGWAVIRAYGSVRKENPNTDYNYAIYEIVIDGVEMDVPQIVGMGPNGTGSNQYWEQVSWQLGKAFELSPGVHTIEVHGSQYKVDSGTGNVILCDGPGTENQAHLDVFVLYSRTD